MSSSRIAALVIGGGPAGSAIATRLALAGREVTLLEREAEPVDKVCGEFLSREAALYLAALSVDVKTLGAASIDSVRVCDRGGVACAKLPFSALSVSRRVLDEALLQRAQSAGADVRRGKKVSALTRSSSGAGWSVKLADDSVLSASEVFLATGKYDLRGQKRPAGSQDDLVAFKMYFHLTPEQAANLTSHVEINLFAGGYAGLDQVEGNRANLCLLVRRRALLESRGWDDLLASMCADSPQLDERLKDAKPCFSKPLALSAIPYGYICRRAEGLWRLGDQAAVIPSFSGDGMSIALHSAELAATAYLNNKTADEYQAKLAHDVSMQMMLATVLSHALVHRHTQKALSAVVRIWPGLMSKVAFHTRVSDAALRRADLTLSSTP